MAPRVDPVASDTEAPPRTGVVVIGGGIIGACTAFFLARKGVPVVLCEKGHIAGEQSSRNWGWCRKMGRDPREIPLAIEALRLWPEMNALTEAETGFRRCGIVYLCKTPEEMAKREAWLEEARPYQLDTRMLSRDEAAAVLPGLSGDWQGGLYTPSDGRGEPQKAAPAIAAAAQRHGAVVLQQCAVRGIETQGGRVAGVVTERGRIACDSVVLAGGVWSRLFCGNLDLRLPQLKVMSSVMRTEAFDGGLETSCSGFGFGVRKRLDGGYNVASWSGNVVDIVPDTFRFFSDFLPALRLQWRGMRLRIGGKFLEEWQVPRRWALDAASPFERVRTLGSGTVSADPGSGAHASHGGVPGVPRHEGGGELGWRDRRHARCGAGDLRGRYGAGVLHRDRVHRSWLRHRSWGGTADGGAGHRRDAGGRSDAVPLQPLHGRVTAGAVAAGLTRPS